jgi:ABC-type multidrug transport system fused ATPase/permease subunit
MTTPSILSAIQKLRSLLTREEKIKWLGIVGFALCTSLLEVVTASVIVVFAQVLNQPEAGQKYFGMIGLEPSVSPGHIVFYVALIVGVVYLIKNLVAAAEVFYQNFSIQKMNCCFKDKFLHLYAKSDYGFHLTRNSVFGVQIINSDTEQMFSSGMISIATILSESVVFICLIGLVVWMNPNLALIFFAFGSISGVFVAKILLPKFYSWGQKLQKIGIHTHQYLQQFLHAFKEILLLGKQEAFVNAYQYHSHKKSRVQAIQNAVTALPRMVIEVLFVGLFVITIMFLCSEHESPTQMIGILGGYLYAGFRLMPGLNRIINQLNTFKSTIPSIERVYNEYISLAAKENYVNVPEFQFDREISLKDISFRYLNTKKDDLSGISLKIQKGECVGIVGETGSGKSTLVDIILGLLRPYEGEILSDGKFPVNSYQWQQKIGYVPQSIYLIDDTIEANIAFGEQDINETQLNAAIDAAQLSKFINQLPERAKTLTGERGIRLSGGERQRIAIARALYRNPEVLIFDEATSALDIKTEARLMKTIQAVSQNRTVIMIAHRLTTLKDCDRIVVMEKGTIKQIIEYEKLESNMWVQRG